MTAVAPPFNLQSVERPGWTSNGTTNGHAPSTMSAGDVSRMLLPRTKSASRSNSSASINSLSSTSSTTTLSASSQPPKTNGVGNATNGDWGSRKRAARGIWQPSKSEPIAGLSTARPQSVNSASGPSATSAMSALNGMSHPGVQPDAQQNGALGMNRGKGSEPTPVLYLTPMNGTFERKTINVPYYPDVLRIGRQTNNKTMPTPANGYFDSKVLSRQHAEIWADRNGKIWIRDVKSSNGTFVNGQRLSQENKDSDPHELREQDMLELGIDIVSEDQKTVVHHKVAARVELAGFYEPSSVLELNFGDLDASATAGLIGGNLGQSLSQMRRTASQSSLNSNGRASLGSAATGASNGQQRAPHFWLAPVNMDKIIQKLNAECKAAKLQSLDLQRTQQHIDSILSVEPHSAKKDTSQKLSPSEKVKAKDSFKGRFSDPPAPPPQAPLPEKPDLAALRNATGIGAAVAAFSPSLTRTETAKPQMPFSPTGIWPTSDTVASSREFANLMEQLSKARQEVETERQRLKETEENLLQERVKREEAEERAKRLESQRLYSPPLSVKSEDTHTPIDDEQQDMAKQEASSLDPEILQEKFNLLLAEFSKYKEAAEQWRVEKELAERERDEERKERLSLAEMIEKIKAEELGRSSKRHSRSRRRSRLKSLESPAMFHDGAEDSSPDAANMENGPHETNGSLGQEAKSVRNGHPVSAKSKGVKGSDQSDTDRSALIRRELALRESAPYLSAVSVVLLGVAVMAFLNKMQRGESIK